MALLSVADPEFPAGRQGVEERLQHVILQTGNNLRLSLQSQSSVSGTV